MSSSSSSSPLSSDQQIVYDAVVTRRQSVFLTGCAGTGKSFLLHHLIQALSNTHKSEKKKKKLLQVCVTATTGIAAVPLNGVTIHSFASIGFGQDPKEVLCAKINNSYIAKKKWKDCDVLIIDEISMMDGGLFDKIEYISRHVRGDASPFGGIQLILTGDFLQLPPIKPIKGFCFEADSWSTCVPPSQMYNLTTVFRQTDSVFVGILDQIRKGILTPASKRSLDACLTRSFEVQYVMDQIEPTLLYARKVEVAAHNKDRLDRLTTDPVTYVAVNQGSDSRAVDLLQKNSPASDEMTLKVGCQVILICNYNPNIGLANGSRGVVIALEKEETKDSTMISVQNDKRWPKVRFVNGREEVIKPHTWKTEVKGKIVASRTQIPFILGYAITVHRCQGMTLDRVQLNLDSTFEYGQAYVALSRAKGLDNLCLVTKVEASMIRTHPKALAFYQQHFTV